MLKPISSAKVHTGHGTSWWQQSWSEGALEDSLLAQPWAVGLSEPLGGVGPSQL